MDVGEVLTLQLGPESNAVGTRFWNTVFREEGEGEKKEKQEENRGGGVRSWEVLGRKDLHGRYVPNVICVDTKGGFGTLAMNGEDEAVLDAMAQWHDAGLWRGRRTLYDQREASETTHMHEEEQQEEQEEDIPWWREAAARRLSRRGLHCIESVRVGALDPFVDYEEGLVAMESTEERERLEDCLRWWQESTESRIGGLRLLWDCNGGFGGVTEAAVLYMSEENPKTDVCSIPIARAQVDNIKLLNRNMALGVVRVAPHTALTLPVACDSRSLVSSAWDVFSYHTRGPSMQFNVCQAISRAKANIAWARVACDGVSKFTNALALVESTISTSLIPLPSSMAPIAERRFLRHVVATLSPNASEIDKQLALARAQGKVPIWAVFSATSEARTTLLQLGQSREIAMWLKELQDSSNLCHEVRNDLALQQENYDDDDLMSEETQ